MGTPDHTPSRRWPVAAKLLLVVLVATAVVAACTQALGIKDPSLQDGGTDTDAATDGTGGIDAAVDAATDGRAIDATIDAPVDAAIDAPPPQCTTGPCCSPGGTFEPTTKVCAMTTEFRCTDGCGGQPQQRTVSTSCSGTSAACNGQIVNGPFTNVGSACGAEQLCELQVGAQPRCAPCGFGCNPTADACRPAKLFLFQTVGAFQGGGTVTPVGGRAGADAKCFTDFTNRFANLACTAAHTHAVLSINAAEPISTMAGTFGIPINVPVHRANDDVLVSNTWNDFINPNLLTIAPPTSATPGNGFVWTGGNGADTCGGWGTSSVGSGIRGDTTSTTALRLSNDALACNLTSRLLCVCRSGP